MNTLDWSDEEIERNLAEDDYWEEGKLHVSIHRLYLDVVCPDDCPSNEIGVMGFCYCEEGCPYGDVCYSYNGAMHKFNGKSRI